MPGMDAVLERKVGTVNRTELARELGVRKVDFVGLKYMNPIVKHYAKKDFIYV